MTEIEYYKNRVKELEAENELLIQQLRQAGEDYDKLSKKVLIFNEDSEQRLWEQQRDEADKKHGDFSGATEGER